MEIVLSSNAQTAEEAASASKTLEDQALNVKEIVNTLILLVEGADALKDHIQHQKPLAASSQKRISNMQKPQAKSIAKVATKAKSPESIIPLGDF